MSDSPQVSLETDGIGEPVDFVYRIECEYEIDQDDKVFQSASSAKRYAENKLRKLGVRSLDDAVDAGHISIETIPVYE